jgi:hypothetical protein
MPPVTAVSRNRNTSFMTNIYTGSIMKATAYTYEQILSTRIRKVFTAIQIAVTSQENIVCGMKAGKRQPSGKKKAFL